jgi:hypothetical protein
MNILKILKLNNRVNKYLIFTVAFGIKVQIRAFSVVYFF